MSCVQVILVKMNSLLKYMLFSHDINNWFDDFLSQYHTQKYISIVFHPIKRNITVPNAERLLTGEQSVQIWA